MPDKESHSLAEDLNQILSHTASMWEELRDKRLFITGGTGFIGCWLLESFIWANKKLNLNAEAVVLTRHPDAFAKKYPYFSHQSSLHLHKGDVRNFTYPEGIFSHVIHAATDVSVAQHLNDSSLMMDTIVQGTKHTLEFARNAGVRKFLFVSSGAVYGKQPATLPHISEEYTCQPDAQSSYATGKYMAEQECAIYAKEHDISLKIARCFAFVGPYLALDSHHAIGNFIRDALAGKCIQVNGDGTPYRSYLYAADLTVWLWTILFRGASCRPYNVGCDQAMSIAQVAQLVSDNIAQKPGIKVMKSPLPGATPERYIPDINRVKQELNLMPQMRLAEAIQATCRWFSHETGHNICK